MYHDYCTICVAKRKMLISFALFSHMQIVGFLMQRLKYKKLDYVARVQIPRIHIRVQGLRFNKNANNCQCILLKYILLYVIYCLFIILC